MKLFSFIFIVFSLISIVLNSSEERVTFGCKKFPIEGILTLPESNPKALVILIHGSGILDENASIGPNKIFLDITNYLVKQSFAVFRFPKRNFVYKNHYYVHPPLNLKEEALDDAHDAIDTLEKLDATQNLPIILLGHSQGGALVPHLARFHESVKGVILLAAPARDAFNFLIDQYEHLSKIKTEHTHTYKHQYETYKHLRDPKHNKNVSEFLGISKIYWNDWSHTIQRAPKVINELKMPSLVIGFGNDYQVTIKDFSIYKRVLKNNNLSECHWMKKVNHMLFFSKDRSYRTYFEKHSVYEPLLKKICLWIDAQV